MPTQLEQDITKVLTEITGLQLTFIRCFKGTVFTSYLYSGAGGYCSSDRRRKNLEANLRFRLHSDRIRVALQPISSDEILVAMPNIEGSGLSFLELMSEVEKTITPLRTMSDKALLPFWKECVDKGQGMCADLKGILPITCGIDYKGMPIVKSISEELSGFQFVIGKRLTGLTSYLNASILSLAYLRSPKIVKFVVIDPSSTMPSYYRLLPHMALPIAQGSDECISALRWCCQEIDRRTSEFRNDRYFSQLRPEGIVKTIEAGGTPSPFIVVFINDMNFLTWDKSKDIAKMLTTISGAWKQGFRVLVCANEITQGNLSGEAYDCFQSRIWAGLKIDSLKRYNHFSTESLSRYKNAYGPGEVSDEYQTVFIQNTENGQNYFERVIASFYSSKDAEVLKLFKDKKWKEAIEAFEKGWRTNPELQYRVAECFNEGKGVAEDKAKAFEWYLKAAEGGHPKAQRDVGMAYLYGTSADKNIEKGLTWLEKAATQNDGLASLFLGREYFQGKILPQDYSKATEWLEKALAKRDPLFSVEIALWLGAMYMDEQSDIYNLQKAREAFETAEDVAVNGECSDLFKSGGHDRNIKQLKELREKLSHVKIAQGLEKLKALAASSSDTGKDEECVDNDESATKDRQDDEVNADDAEKQENTDDDTQDVDGADGDEEEMLDEDGEEVVYIDDTCYKASDHTKKAIFKDEEGRYQFINGEAIPYEGNVDASVEIQAADECGEKQVPSNDGLENAEEDAEMRDDLINNDKQTGETAMKEFDLEKWQEPANVNLKGHLPSFWEGVKDSLSEDGVILRLDDIIVSPFSVVLSINCDDHNATIGRPQVLYRLKDALDVFDEHSYVIESLPETCNIGIGFRRSYDADEAPSLTEMVNSPAYKKLEKDPNAVPIVFGINHMNEPLIANLADSDNMVIMGGDSCSQGDTADVIVNGLMHARNPYDLQLTVLDGNEDAPQIVGWYAGFQYSKNSLSSSPTDKNLISWCKRAISIFDEVERDCAMRRKIIESSNCDYDHIQEYNRVSGRNLAHRVVMMANFPGRFKKLSEEAKNAIDKLKSRVHSFIELDKADVGIHFILWDFGVFWDNFDADMSLADTLLASKNKSQFVAYTRFDELGTLLNFAGGKEACDSNNLGPLVYRSPEGEIHYFQFAKVKDDERKLAIDKWGLTRAAVNDNIPDDEGDENERETTEGDDDLELNFGNDEEHVDVIAEPAG